ncbi:tRNA pseudouridine(38-40) synthase TruA [Galbibacter pacificus]|uniref:tRNA pseudouridine synthase A n=1 Tax=Galbibacter pacificus TaxID=2996052 RepID=A0ABT6FVL5_9FLAO|nr:tRNA pseudouridine(38-40) synthase TruA [Galbibacter pacificus]MDG3583764.1 tRNA pseudouridine(38-40) synthase TruA [Galbibacter pacificus]MDG3587318.1 tRNA pseudouridine(38-40) synthase TruA [Galbibacter pacificus]
MRYFLELSYNGKHYHGWQNQPNAISVQEVLEKALSTLLRAEIQILGAGRTDSGVHAKQMYAHFDMEIMIDKNELIYKLNSFLPTDIAIHDIKIVNSDAHARFDAEQRSYEYWIVQQKDPFYTDFAYYLKANLNVDKMNEAATELLKHKDFQCFSKSNTDVKTYICDVKKAVWVQEKNKLVFYISADRFLRNMVRAIVGTLINVGMGKSSVEDVKKIIESKKRSNAGASVPAHGLYLTEVLYPDAIYKNINE